MPALYARRLACPGVSKGSGSREHHHVTAGAIILLQVMVMRIPWLMAATAAPFSDR